MAQPPKPKETWIMIGNQVYIRKSLIVAVMPSKLKRVRIEAQQDERLIKATGGKKARSMILLKNNHVIVTQWAPKTLIRRLLMKPKYLDDITYSNKKTAKVLSMKGE